MDEPARSVKDGVSALKGSDSEKGLPETTADEDTDAPQLSAVRRIMLMILLCSAQFFDIFNAISSVIALPQIAEELHFDPGAPRWVISAYALTFASLQLVGGRMTDIYDPRPVFCAGYLALGVFGIICGFSVNPIMLVVFRALQGIGAALTIPSAVAMITTTFREPKEQAKVLAFFAAAGAVGTGVGFVVGGVLTANVHWSWVFWLVAIMAVPSSLASYFILPKAPSSINKPKRSLDIPGVTILTAGFILLIYALSDANSKGWAKPQILVTLILSFVCLVAFYFVERVVKDPVVPPSTWSNRKFVVLFVLCWSIYWYFTCSIFQLVDTLWGWSALNAAVHALPIGISAGIFATLAGMYGHLINRTLLLVGGQVLMAVSVILYALADGPEKYWSHIFPGTIVGTIGLPAAYVGLNVAIMGSARKGEEGVAGALMNSAFQLGAAVGLAVVTAVTLGVNATEPLDAISQFHGYAASFWSILALHGIMLVIAAVFVH